MNDESDRSAGDRPAGGCQGKGDTLGRAFEDAWKKVRNKDPQRWYPAELAVRGENPIREYRVTIIE